MREILFRAKGDPKWNDGSWEYGFICKDGDGDWQIRGECWSRTVLEETIGQFTGFYDHTSWEDLTLKEQSKFLRYRSKADWKGRPIFEGDILKWANYFDFQCYKDSIENPEKYNGFDFSDDFKMAKVIWCDCECPAFDVATNEFEGNGLTNLICYGAYHCEVVGNIYDNPELLH